MNLSVNLSFLYKQKGIDKAIDLIIDAGFDAIDFSFYEKYFDEIPTDKEYFTELRKRVEDKGVIFNQAHAPADSSSIDEHKTEILFKNIVSSLERASYLGVENVVVHPCQHLKYEEDGVPEKLYEYNMNYFKRLIPYAEEYGVRICIENMWQDPGLISHSTCSRPNEMIKYSEGLNSERIGCCLDIGHAMLVRESPADFIRTLGGERLTCLHVHDVDGIDDKHDMPYFGIINWKSVMKSLKEINYKGDLTFELTDILAGIPEALHYDYVKLAERTGRQLIDMFKN